MYLARVRVLARVRARVRLRCLAHFGTCVWTAVICQGKQLTLNLGGSTGNSLCGADDAPLTDRAEAPLLLLLDEAGTPVTSASGLQVSHGVRDGYLKQAFPPAMVRIAMHGLYWYTLYDDAPQLVLDGDGKPSPGPDGKPMCFAPGETLGACAGEHTSCSATVIVAQRWVFYMTSLSSCSIAIP